MIGNEFIGLFCVPKELKLSSDTYCSFLKNLMEPKPCNLFLAQTEEDHLLAGSSSCMILVSEQNSLHVCRHAFFSTIICTDLSGYVSEKVF